MKIFFDNARLQQTLIVCTSKKDFFLVLDMQHDSGALRKSRGNGFPTECCIFFTTLCWETFGCDHFQKGKNSIRLGDKSILHASSAGAGYKFTRSRIVIKHDSLFFLDLHINVCTVVVVVYDSYLLSPHHQRKWTDIVDQFHWYQTLPHPLRTKLRSFFPLWWGFAIV